MKKMVLAALGALALVAALAVAPPARAADISIDGNIRAQCGEGVSAAGAITLNNKCAVITTEGLTTAAGSDYTLTVTNSVVAASDIVLFTVQNGTNTGGAPVVRTVTPAAGSVVAVIRNNCQAGGHASCTTAFNGNLTIRWMVIKYGS